MLRIISSTRSPGVTSCARSPAAAWPASAATSPTVYCVPAAGAVHRTEQHAVGVLGDDLCELLGDGESGDAGVDLALRWNVQS